MKDDSVFCECFNGLPYLPFWRHELSKARNKHTIRALSCAVGVLAVALIVALVTMIGG